MKRRSILQFAIDEFRHSVFLFVLCLLLLTSILSAAIFIISADKSLMSTFYTYASSLSANKSGVEIIIGKIPYDSLHLLEDLPLDSVTSFVRVNSGKFDYKGKSLSAFWGTAQDINLVNKLGLDPDYHSVNNNHLEKYIWLSEELSEQIDCKIGDAISQNEGNGLKYSYIIKGFYSIELASKYKLGDFFVPMDTYFDINKKAGYACQLEISAILSNPSNYYRTKSILKNRGIIISTDLDDEYMSLALIDSLFRILFFVFLFSSMLIVYFIIKIIIRNRIGYIMRLRMLGVKSRHIIMIYSSILELIVLISFSIGYILNKFFTGYIADVIKQVFPNVPFSSSNPLHFIVIGIAVCTAIICIISFAYARKIDCSNIAELLQGN